MSPLPPNVPGAPSLDTVAERSGRCVEVCYSCGAHAERFCDFVQYAAQARMEHERRDAALRRIAALVDALPEVEPDSVMMVSVRARDVLALREVVAEWRSRL